MSTMKTVVEKHFLHMEIIVNPKVCFLISHLESLKKLGKGPENVGNLQQSVKYHGNIGDWFIDGKIAYIEVISL